MLGAGGAKKKMYLDDMFSTYVYTGTGSARSINNGINLSGEGGMTWVKRRDGTYSHWLMDTVRGGTKMLASNSNGAESTASGAITSFNNNGFTLGNETQVNVSGTPFASWTFRKAKGFFDVVTYTGTGTKRTVNHGLGCRPGLIMIKRTDGTHNWDVWSEAAGKKSSTSWSHLVLNSANASSSTSRFGIPGTDDPTSTTFTVKDQDGVNANGASYIAYVFAGGKSTAATARSVEMDGTGDYFTTSTSSDYTFGTGDFTVEHWMNLTGSASNWPTVVDARTDGSYTNQFVTYMGQDQTIRFNKGSDRIASTPLATNTWNHIAVCRSSGVTTLYLNGTSQGTWNDATNYTNTSFSFGANAVNQGHTWEGKFSNLRIVKGTALYTSSFKPATVPLTNITNTKLLCFNDSSTTGATVGTITASGDPTASTDSPFDDPAGFVFGENGDQNVIKCGSYKGSDTAYPEIDLGFEPQWLLIKRTSDTANWLLFDSMRGVASGGNDEALYPDGNYAESSAVNYIQFTPTGFKFEVNNDTTSNNTGDTYIYIAIRRPDGYVGKPADAGTDVFNMIAGTSDSSLPTFPSGFITDFTIRTTPGSTQNRLTSARLTGHQYLYTNATDAEGSSAPDAGHDYNTGFGNWTYDLSSWQAWLWKRHAGFDVVTFEGDGASGRPIPHSLNKTPEMIWLKNRGNAADWMVGHKGLDGGTNPWTHYLNANTTSTELDEAIWADTAPTSTHFSVGAFTAINNNAHDYIAMLFASVDGVSKVGSYTGNGNSTQTITTGFQPRFLIIRRTEIDHHWYILDTTRGWGSGDDKYLLLESNTAQADYDFGAPTSTGFTMETIGSANNANYIYYAHA